MSHTAVAFPQLEQHFDLPTYAIQQEAFFRAQLVGIGENYVALILLTPEIAKDIGTQLLRQERYKKIFSTVLSCSLQPNYK